MTPETPPDLIDVGCNLAHRDFDPDRPEVLARAQKAGVRTIVATGTDLRGSRRAIELARHHPGAVYATCGVHPHNASSHERDAAHLVTTARDPLAVAIGECGLDFDRDFSPRPVQERAFARQIELAIETGKPLFLHERKAHARFLSVLDDYRDHGTFPVPAVVHCFTGPPDHARAYLDRGFHLGVTGWVCQDRRNTEILQSLPLIPLDRLLVETDAPFLSPSSTPRTRNEPENLPLVVRRIAQVIRRTPDEVATLTTINAQRFFRLPTWTATESPREVYERMAKLRVDERERYVSAMPGNLLDGVVRVGLAESRDILRWWVALADQLHIPREERRLPRDGATP